MSESNITTGGADTSVSQPAREQNIEALVAYFESGIKTADEYGALGIEHEHIIVHDDLTPVSYSEEHGVAWLLGKLQETYPKTTRDMHGDLLGVRRRGEAVTLEPASQVELSAGPFTDLATAQLTFMNFEHRLYEILSPVHERALTLGYHPSSTAHDLELIPKRRYEFMNSYLGKREKYALCMMRGSASTQICIDYTSVDDCLRKMRIAFALVPLLSLICDNSPVFEGKPRPHKLMRTDIWNHVDKDRCGLIPGILDPHFSLRDLATYILDTPAILIPSASEQWRYSDATFGEIYANRAMTYQEIEHATSMFFTDVRLKTYIEIRPADAMPVPYIMAYAALIKGLFHNADALCAVENLLGCITEADFDDAKNALMQHGYDALVYGAPAAQLCDRIVVLAKQGLDATDRIYIEPLADLVAHRTTLADMAEKLG